LPSQGEGMEKHTPRGGGIIFGYFQQNKRDTRIFDAVLARFCVIFVRFVQRIHVVIHWSGSWFGVRLPARLQYARMEGNSLQCELLIGPTGTR